MKMKNNQAKSVFGGNTMKRTILLITMILMVASFANAYTIDGDNVYVDDSKVFINITPHTLVGSGWVYVDLNSKVYSGNITAMIGVNKEFLNVKYLEVYNPYTEIEQHSYTCDNSFNYTLTPKHAWCYDEVNGSIIFNHSFESGDIPSKTIFWSENVEHDYKRVNADFNIINYEYDGKNKWFVLKDIPIVQDVPRQVRIWFEMPRLEIGESKELYDAKYDFAFMPSAYSLKPQGILNAINNNHFYFIDPWTRGTTGLIHYWNHDDTNTSGTISIGYNDTGNGTLTNGVTSGVTGKIGEAYDFDGTNDYVGLGNFADGGTMSVSAWVKLDTYPAGGSSATIASRWGPGSDLSWILQFAGTSTNLSWSGRNTCGVLSTSSVSGWAGDGIWHHVVATQNSTLCALYIDGTLNNTAISTGIVPSVSTTTRIGSEIRNGRYLNGMIDEVGIWDVDLDLTDVEFLYNSGAPGTAQQPPFSLASINETEARTAIEQGINSSLNTSTIYYDQKVYSYDGTHNMGSFDLFVTSGSQHWAFNYVYGSDSYTNMSSIGTTLNVWENASLTTAEIITQVGLLINTTKD